MGKKISAAENVLRNLMKVKKSESLLIIFDEGTFEIAENLYLCSKNITRTVLAKIPVGKMHGEEPPSNVSELMRHFDVIIIPTMMSLSHTDARRQASKAGARIATMPGITKDMFTRTLSADYSKIEKTSLHLQKIFNNSKTVKVTTKKGTDMTFKLRKFKTADTGIIQKKHEFGNLPAGEAGSCPIEGSSNGKIVVDASFGGIGKLSSDIILEVESGFVKKITGGKDAKKLVNILKGKKNPAVYNIAEFAVGTNPFAKITGKILEDEKVLGTCHFALGNNMSMGGKINAPIHLDGVIRNPTIILDGKKTIMKEGRLVV